MIMHGIYFPRWMYYIIFFLKYWCKYNIRRKNIYLFSKKRKKKKKTIWKYRKIATDISLICDGQIVTHRFHIGYLKSLVTRKTHLNSKFFCVLNLATEKYELLESHTYHVACAWLSIILIDFAIFDTVLKIKI